jgi:5,10-methylenetetrahydromethanopterin reductase
MRIGLFSMTVNTGTVDDITAEARRAADDGFASYWVPHIFGLDAMTALAIAGREVGGIELGTAVVPTYPRHPWVMAQQALTTQAAVGGRLALGIGLSHQVVVEGMWGISFSKPVLHLREYLEVLVPLSQGETVSFNGRTVSAHGAIRVAGATPFPILVAALGPQLLEVTGLLADGTITWCVGPQTLAGHTVPILTAAAARAGRAVPRVVAALPVAVSSTPERTLQRAGEVFEMYPRLPSYRAMLDREGADTVADIAIVGTASEVTDRIGALSEIGVTDFVAADIAGDPQESEATRAALRELVAQVA